MKLFPRLPLYLFVAALAAAFWRALPPAPPQFVPPPAPRADTHPAHFASGNLPAPTASAHAASLVELADGRIACAWFGGSREGAADVAIWLSTWEGGQWSAPRVILDRARLSGATRQHVRRLGNPVLARQNDRLHLWVVSTGIGGWATSSLNHLESTDGGQHWSSPERLTTSPFLNISTLVRTPPLALADGGLALPAYHELLAKQGEWLRLDADGRLLDKVRLPQEGAAIQPTAVALSATEALALLRDAGPAPGHIRVARTADGGQRWQTDEALELTNPDASLALLRLASGRLVLAANPGAGRRILDLWLSDDQGRHWRHARRVEQAADGEFSYPALIQATDGSIHLAYTWQRQAIRHAVFSEAWLLGGDA